MDRRTIYIIVAVVIVLAILGLCARMVRRLGATATIHSVSTAIDRRPR